MIDVAAVVVLFGSFVVLIACGMHIAFALGVSSVFTFIYLGLPLEQVAQNMVRGINVFALMAVPFFIVAGEVMGQGGISRRLIQFSNSIVGWFRGGLAMVNVVASMFFGGISGSAAADTASIGSILIPIMKEEGYEDDFSAGITVASSIQGILIPPSHNMVIFSLAAGGVSIGRLFLAGFAPGLLLGVALMIYSFVIARKRGYPKGDAFSLLNILKSAFSSIWGLGTVVIVVVGVVGGAFTATESAAIAVLYSLIIAVFVYRELPPKRIKTVLSRTIQTLSAIMILVGSATAFGWLITYLEIPVAVTNFLLGLSTNKYIIFLIINVLLLFLGTFLNMVSIILILTPILLPVVTTLGMDPVHFGVVMILNLGIGLITPPVGTVMFIGSAVSGVSVERLTRALVPFYIVMVITLLVVTFVPDFVMFLPNWFMPPLR